MLVGGVWQRSPPNKEQQHELKADEVTIIGPADAEVGAVSLGTIWTDIGSIRMNMLTDPFISDLPDPEKIP